MIIYQVFVLTGDHLSLRYGQPTHEHLVEVLANNHTEAALIACQMASSVRPDDVPFSAEVITDSTLESF